MKVTATKIEGVKLLEPEPYSDERGQFARIFCEAELARENIPFCIRQINVSRNTRALTLRGLHWKEGPQTEGKIIFVVRGRVFDVAVDLRRSSPTFTQWVGFNLDAVTQAGLHIPEGCAHGFMTLEPNSELLYCMNKLHTPGYDRGARFDDPAFSIGWPYRPKVIAERDLAWPSF